MLVSAESWLVRYSQTFHPYSLSLRTEVVQSVLEPGSTLSFLQVMPTSPSKELMYSVVPSQAIVEMQIPGHCARKNPEPYDYD